MLHVFGCVFMKSNSTIKAMHGQNSKGSRDVRHREVALRKAVP